MFIFDSIEFCILFICVSLFITVFCMFLCPDSGEDWAAISKKFEEDFNKEEVENPLDLMK